MSSEIGLYIKRLDNMIRRSFYQQYENRREADEMTRGNMWVLEFLYHNPDREICQKDIEERSYINRSTASKMLKRMQEHGYIERKPSSRDCRSKRLILTEKSIACIEACKTAREELENNLAEGITAEEKETFLRICKKIIQNMEEKNGWKQSEF